MSDLFFKVPLEIPLRLTEDIHLPPEDRDNDSNSGNCAVKYKGAWWYNNCYHSNLNGLYLHGKVNDQGMVWYHWKKNDYSVKRFEMKIRPKDF